jgi:hypothetical protein
MELTISFTGVRSGEYICGSPKSLQCKGSILQIKGFYKPSREFVSTLDEIQIRDKFNNFKFFKRLNVEERIRHLTQNLSEVNDQYLEDVSGLMVKVIRLEGKYVIASLTKEQIDELIAGNPEDKDGYWPIQTLYHLFPKNPRSKGKGFRGKHSLVFRPRNWVLQPDTVDIPRYEGLCIDMETGNFYGGLIEKPIGGSIFIVKPENNSHLKQATESIGIVCSSNLISRKKLTIDHLFDLWASMGFNREIMNQIKSLIDWFPPSIHKSLIQKLIRTKCSYVTHRDLRYPSREFLAVTFGMLLVHKGSFIEKIQRFVTGIESALKRLAISIYEDSYLEDAKVLTSLLAGSWIYQSESDTDFVPNDIMLQKWMLSGVLAMEDERCYKYDWYSIPDSGGIIKEWSSHYVNYYLLSVVRAFSSDEKMVCSIAENQGNFREILRGNFEISMPLVHCIDHHSLTSIIHYLPPQIVAQYYDGTFKPIFSNIWTQVVSYTPRKECASSCNALVTEQSVTKVLNEFQAAIRQAQIDVWNSESGEIVLQPLKVKEYKIINYNLHHSWLSAFVGPTEFKSNIIVINPDDLSSYITVRRPSRGAEETPQLTEEEKLQVISQFKLTLQAGVKFQSVPDTLKMFSGSTLYLLNDQYYITFPDGTSSTFEEAFKLKMSIPIHPSAEYSPYSADGIVEGGPQKLVIYLKTLSGAVLRRSLLYISSFGSEIELYHISREDGKGTKYSIALEDVAVHQLLRKICEYYPGALEKIKEKFKVKNGPLFWMIVTYIKSLTNYENKNFEWNISTLIPEKRQLWEHQLEAIEKLKSRDKRVKLIWCPVGLGKTGMITNYIASLIREGKMTKYCLYTCPASASQAIIREFELLGIPIQHLDMRQDMGGAKGLTPGIVNLIYHDHLRLSNLEQIRQCSSETMFINDEFHKTMSNKSIRTSLALELSQLSVDVIAMTGTLIKDTNVDDLIKWLSQSVDFEVNIKNYWVAIATIISRKIETKVGIERVIIDAEMNLKEKEDYYSCVTEKFGGTAHKIDFNRAVEISYCAINREILSQINFYLSVGIGCFVVAKDIKHQQLLKSQINSKYKVELIEKDHYLNYTSSSQGNIPDIVITTPQHAEGYNMTKFMVMISGVYFSNEATRQQLEGRINRIDQLAPTIRYIIIHSGIISYIYLKYEKARDLSKALQAFAKEIEM